MTCSEPVHRMFDFSGFSWQSIQDVVKAALPTTEGPSAGTLVIQESQEGSKNRGFQSLMKVLQRVRSKAC